MKKSTSSQPQTLKTTLGIITLLIAAMTFNSCEKVEDMYPELSEGTFENEQVKQMPDTKLSGQPVTQVDKINTLSQENINPDHVAANNNEAAQSINANTRTNKPTTTPKPMIEGTRWNQQIKQMPDTKLSGQPLNKADKINTMSQENINPDHVAQSISSEIKQDTENRPNNPRYTTIMTTTIPVHPRD